MARILAIDYGKKRTGVAVTDPLQIIANGLITVDTKEILPYVKQYVAENEVETIVVGLPRQMNGEYSESFKYIAPFVERLKKALPETEIVYFDERFTSKMALQSMIAGGVKKSERRNNKGLVDRVSAAIILQSYLESRRKNG